MVTSRVAEGMLSIQLQRVSVHATAPPCGVLVSCFVFYCITYVAEPISKRIFYLTKLRCPPKSADAAHDLWSRSLETEKL